MSGSEANHDPDAPWRRSYTGSPPTPERPDRGSVVASDTHDADQRGSGDPWSRAVVHDHADGPLTSASTPLTPSGPLPPAGPLEVTVADGPGWSTSRREVVLCGVSVGAAVAVAAMLVGALLAAGPTSSRITFAPRLPSTVELRWSDEHETLVASVVIGGGLVVAASRGGDVIGYDEFTGDRRWVVDIGSGTSIATLALIDDVVVVTDTQPGNRAQVHVIDVVTGEIRWRETSDALAYLASGRSIFRLAPDGSGAGLQVLDLRDGTVRATFVRDPDQAYVAGPFVASIVDGRASLYDLDTLEPVGRPVIATNLRWLTVLDGQVVGLSERGAIVLFDRNGDPIDSATFSSDAVGSVPPQLVGLVPDHRIAIRSSDTSAGFTVTDGAIEVVWEVDGFVGPPAHTDLGDLAVAQRFNNDTGDVDHAIIDVLTGQILREADSGATHEHDPVLGRDGYIVAPEIGAPDHEVSAVAYDGTELWSLSVPSDRGDYLVGDGVVVTIDRRDDGTSVIAAFGAVPPDGSAP
jgi:hypothetical protein